MGPGPFFRILVLECKCRINRCCIHVHNAVPAEVTARRARGPLGVLQNTLGAEKDARLASIQEDKVRKDREHALRMRVMGDERRKGRRQEMREAELHRARMERHRMEMKREEVELELLEMKRKIKLAQLERLEQEAN